MSDAAFDDVYTRHVAAIWRYVRVRVPDEADADDVTADVFAAAVRSWHRFDAERGSVGAWLIGIARHAIADWWQRTTREVPMREVESEADRSLDDAGPEAMLLRRLAVDDVRSRLGVLTDREREAVAMRFGAELTSEEIGATLGISAAGARMLVYRAVAKLREGMRP